MKPEDVNYEPLGERKNAFLYVMNNTWSGALWLLALVSFIAGIGLAFLLSNPMTFFIILPISVWIGHLVSKRKNQAWLDFAAANGWGFDTESPYESVIPPSLNFGHDQNLSPVIQAQFGGITCDLFSYDTTTGSGKNSTGHYFTAAIIKLPKTMPHIVLRTKQSEADTQDDMANAEVLKLEGDFDDYFKLQIEKGQEIDVLAIITPDVMRTIVDYNQREDLEFLDDNLYFIVRGDVLDPKYIKQLIQSVDELNEQLVQNSKLADSGVASSNVSPETVMPEDVSVLKSTSWNLSRVFAKPNPARSDVVAGVVIAIILAVLFIWMFIALKNMPQ